MEKILYIGNKLEKHGQSPTSADILPELFRIEGLDVLVFSAKKNKVLRFLDITSHILKHAPSSKFVLIDTYSTLNFWIAVWSGFLCFLLRLNYVTILRGGNLSYRLRNNKNTSKFLFSNSYKNIIPSKFLYEQFHTHGIPNLEYIPNNIDINKYPFLKRLSPTPKLLWVRAFAEIYNPKMAILVLERVLKNYPEAELCMVGPEKDGSLKAAKKLAQEKGLPVSFTGKLDKKDWIKLSKEYDIFVNTTNIDNTPVTVMEALALGLPVVSTNVGGLPYLIKNNITGILVEPANILAMASGIERLIEDRRLAENLSYNGRKYVEKFDWKKVKALWMELLR
ncbi:glycosyltransferase family 4 protein [Christiangramia sp. SM2212]|uniref:Glycosyltransferase family 4 protein n=1 Tax=Christiangramia sediminicola TaxID=3073267 RepID=A0ABU1ENC2_9FLAO|nr:glycosyltransferase family 4 protein [Christiangramia sp. SM2212]MDR5589723.1 glycosyltransferase family 4 protein [Christiangramia sp. SM2212]